MNADEIVTREALLTGLESCLLSHQSFSLYVFQLVSEKILDDELSDSTKLEICEFLVCVIECIQWRNHDWGVQWVPVHPHSGSKSRKT